MNPYKVLGVPEDADKQTIKKAYRKLASEHHPDRGGDEEKFKEVAEAYSILSDDQKRQQYHARQNHRGGFGMGFEDIFGSGFNPFGDLFNQPRRQKREVKKDTPDSDIQFNLRINLEQIKRGSSQEIRFLRNKICHKCSGSGGEGKRVCNHCGGTGSRSIKHAPFVIQTMPCNACAGQGITFNSPCHPCSTRGFVQIEDKVVVKIEEDKE